MFTRVPREVCIRETVRAPTKTGWAETDKGQPGKPNIRARWVAKGYKTHARPELYASTPPLEALKVVLLEIANVRERLWHWSMCGEHMSTLRRDGECSSNCRPKITSWAMNTFVQLVRHA